MTTTDTHTLDVDFGPYEEAAKRISGLNDRMADSWKAAAGTALDVYERSVNSLVDLSKTSPWTAQLRWTASVAQLQATFLREVHSAQVRAARQLLS